MNLNAQHQQALCGYSTRTSDTGGIIQCRRHSHSKQVAAMLQQLLLTEQTQPLSFFVVSSQYLLSGVSLKTITEALNIYNCTSGLKL